MAAPQVTAEPQRTLPTAANGVNFTPSATAWANNGWVQLTAGLASAVTIVGVILNPQNTAPYEFEIDVGKGAAGAETVVATVCGHIETLAGSANHLFLFGVPIDNIAASTRIAIRLRKSSTTVTAEVLKLVYYNTVSATVGVTANASLVVPSAANGVSVAGSGTAWASSAYVQLSASLTDIVLLGVVMNPVVVEEMEVDIAKGAAASEVVVGTTGCNIETVAGPSVVMAFRVPISVAGANRIAVRYRRSSVTAETATFKLLYISSAGFGTIDVGKTTQRQRISPDAAALAGNAGSATAWANSAWREQIASTAAAIVVVARTIDTPTAAQYETEVGRGAAGAEVVISGDGDNRETALGITHTVPQCVPVDNIAAAQRVAFRHRDSTTTADTFDTGLTYYESPL